MFKHKAVQYKKISDSSLKICEENYWELMIVFKN